MWVWRVYFRMYGRYPVSLSYSTVCQPQTAPGVVFGLQQRMSNSTPGAVITMEEVYHVVVCVLIGDITVSQLAAWLSG